MQQHFGVGSQDVTGCWELLATLDHKLDICQEYDLLEVISSLLTAPTPEVDHWTDLGMVA